MGGGGGGGGDNQNKKGMTTLSLLCVFGAFTTDTIDISFHNTLVTNDMALFCNKASL